MATTYNTVKTAKLVNEADDKAARRAIDACTFLTPKTERDIDFALGIGTHDLSDAPPAEPVTVFDADEVEDIMEAAGPTEADLAKIEAEQR